PRRLAHCAGHRPDPERYTPAPDEPLLPGEPVRHGGDAMRHRLVLTVLAATFALGGAASAQVPSPEPSPGVELPSPSAGDDALADALGSMAAGMDRIDVDPAGSLAECRSAWA